MNLPVTRIRPDDPAEMGYPPTLPIEVAMRTASIPDICAAYDISREEWNLLRQRPEFVADVASAVKALREEGMSFKMKARLQAEELLKRSWQMIHAADGVVPPSVQADLIKFTIRAAGLEAVAKDAAGGQTNLQINIQL